MINKHINPVGWAALMYELDDAREHIGTLIAEMNTDATYGEANFRIDLGHIYSHLNRAWHRRNIPEDFPDTGWTVGSQFPTDLDPT